MNSEQLVDPAVSVPRTPGSVTNELAKVANGGEMSERLYRFLRERLDGMVRNRLSSRPSSLIDTDDVQQRVALKAKGAAERLQFPTRDDFARFCVSIVRNELVDWQRYEFAGMRHPVGGFEPVECLENLAQPEQFEPGEREIAGELMEVAAELLEEECGHRRTVLWMWIYKPEIEEGIEHFLVPIEGKSLPSTRAMYRWIEAFRSKIYNRWVVKFGRSKEDWPSEVDAATQKMPSKTPR